MLSISCAAPQPTDWSGVQISGQLTDVTGKPVSGGHVYAYEQGLHKTTNTMGPADAMSEPSGPDGRYQLVVPEGVYVIAARKRISGSISGPLRNGDLNGQLSQPVKAVRGNRKPLPIIMSEFRQGIEGDPKRILTTGTRIEGRIIDRSGRPVSDVHVFAYEGTFRSDPPDYMALATDENGHFQISLPGGGEYVIGGRTGLRGKPRPDDSIGFWGLKDAPRIIEENSVTTDIVIVVEPYGDSVMP